jgi:LysR family hydrogen peroxide-inducible transcriptional activator
MMSLTQLEYVLAVDRYRHFGKAAKACFVTQPTLSMQLHKLEEDLGIVLFDRSKKPILPTPSGKAVIEQARSVITEMKKLEMLTKPTSLEVMGDFKLAVIPTMSPYVIPLFLEKFSKKYPKVQLKIEELQTSQILQALEQDEIDAGLLVTPLGVEHLDEQVLFYEPFDLYIHPSHALAKKSKITEEDLDGSDLWLLNEGHCFRSQMIRICSLGKKNSVLKNVEFESGNLETLKRLVELNGGYTLLPRLATFKLPASSRALVRPISAPVPAREVSLVVRRLHLKKPILNALRSEILAAVPADLSREKSKKIEVVKI